MVTKALLDIQRLLACSFAFDNSPISNERKKSLGVVIAASSMSARLSLIMKSNVVIRTMAEN